MSLNNKVIWTEGMFLRPQHFQQQERHLKSWIESRCAGLRPYPWGITQLTIDEQMLAMGKFSLLSCSGIFPDGTPFDIPNDHTPPLPLDIDPDKKSDTILLSLPIRRSAGKEATNTKDVDSLSRYYKQETETKDYHSDLDNTEATIEHGDLWTRLRFTSEDQDAFTSIPLAHLVERQADDLVVLDSNFIPTCLHCSAAKKLAGYMSEILGLLHHRGDALAERLASPGAGGVGEIVDFLLLQIVNRYEPLFIHFDELRALHPEALFQITLQMIGELSTITRQEHRPPELPSYKHTDLTHTFEPIVIALQRVLNWVPEARAVPIPLEEHKFGVKTAAVHDQQLLSSAEFILAAHAQVSTDKLQRNFPHQTTISTVDKLRDLVMSHTFGIVITPLAVAPRQIPFHSGFSYFRLDKQNDLWKEIVETGTIAMHFSGEYPGLKLELWAIKE